MIVRSARWGTLFVVLAVLIIVAMGWAAVEAGPLPPESLVRVVLPAVALFLGVVALFAGHVSYPRVQNLRVYLAGYSIGLHSVVYALLVGFASYYVNAVPLPPADYPTLLYAVALLLTWAYSFAPPFPTYRTTRITTWVLVGVQVALLAAVRFFPAFFAVGASGGIPALLAPSRLLSVPALAAAIVAVAVVVTNSFLTPQSFYLRGAFSGLAILAAGSWLLPTIVDALGFGPVSAQFVALLYVVAAPLFLLASMLAHVLARMEHRVSYDPLLQIYNRTYCNQVLAEQSSVVTRPPIAIMMIDIDHFKQVNDTYGHQAGDRILFAVAQAIQKGVVPEGIVCRYGGEELIAFFPGRTGRDIVPLAQRLRLTVESMETSFKSKRISVTISIGISERRTPRRPLPDVVAAADKALYMAKEGGRNQVRFVRIREPEQATRRVR